VIVRIPKTKRTTQTFLRPSFQFHLAFKGPSESSSHCTSSLAFVLNSFLSTHHHQTTIKIAIACRQLRWVNTSTHTTGYPTTKCSQVEFGYVTIVVFWNFVAALHIILHQYESTLISLKRAACLIRTTLSTINSLSIYCQRLTRILTNHGNQLLIRHRLINQLLIAESAESLSLGDDS
jgi:hypothetical protein